MQTNNQLRFFQALYVLWQYRFRLYEGVVQDVRQRYAGSVFGVAWAALYPILMLSIYCIVYVYIFKVRPGTMSEQQYVVLVFSGLVPLLAFNEALVSAAGSLVANRSLLMNTVFPADLIPIRSALSAQIPSLFAQSITLIGSFCLGMTNWQAPLCVMVLWLLLLMFACGLGWILSLLTLVARDILHLIGLILMLTLILSPFAYTPEMVPSKLRALLYLNPLSYFVLSFQESVCYGSWPSASYFFPAAVIAVTTFLGGFWTFRRTKYVFFDYA